MSPLKTEMPYLCPPLKKFAYVGLFHFSSCFLPLKLQNEIQAVDWWHSLDAQFGIDCTKRRAGLDAHSVSLYSNVSLPFFEYVLVIISISLSSITKNGDVFKMILRYHSVPD